MNEPTPSIVACCAAVAAWAWDEELSAQHALASAHVAVDASDAANT